MINFQQVSKRFGSQVVLSDATFQINPGERVGVVGPNGAGKSTVFNLIAGEMEPDGGRIARASRCRLGYVRQQVNAHEVEESLLEYVENAAADLHAMQREIHDIEAALHREATAEPALTGEADGAGPARSQAALLRRLGELQTQFEHLGGYTLRNRAERALCGLGFPPASLNDPFRSFSGGWQSRAELARVLVAEPDVLLLDEPSNYLDVPAVEWLEKHLEEFKGTLILIAHDRFLLNALTTATVEVANSRVERYSGNYDYYARERQLRYEQRLAAQKNQQRKREKLEDFIERFRAKNTKATQAQSKMKQLARMEEIEIPPVAVSPGRIRLRPPPHCGAEVVRIEQAGLSYDGVRWVLRGVDLQIMRGEKIALVGYNGLGKTTLLRMLGGNLPLSEGRRTLGHKVVVGYQSQDFAETMDPHDTVYHTVRSVAPALSDQEVRTLLGGFGFSGDAIEKTVQVLSGGEKVRLAFARLLAQPPNFLILDEPTTHLDIQARETLEQALRDYQGTLCLVSHDIDFIRHVAGGIVAMTPPGITRYAGGYDYYHEKVMEQEARTQGSGFRVQEESRAESSLKPDRKALRQQRAIERQALHEKTKDLKKAIKKAESEVERLEAEKAGLTQQLSNPTEATNFAALSRRLKEVQYEIDIATAKWEEAGEALEKAMGEEG